MADVLFLQIDESFDGVGERNRRSEVGVYLGAGLLFGSWSITEFFAHFSVSSIGYFLGTIGLVVAVVGFPIAGFLLFDLRTPIVVFVLVILGWVTIAAVQGLISLQTIFGVALTAALLFPLYLVVYGVFAGSEYLYRTRFSGR